MCCRRDPAVVVTTGVPESGQTRDKQRGRRWVTSPRLLPKGANDDRQLHHATCMTAFA